MLYSGELSFLRDVLEKSRVNTEQIPLSKAESFFDNKQGIKFHFTKNVSSHTFYKITDALDCRYVFFLLPGSEKKEILFIGPYLSEPISKARCLEISAKHGMTTKEQRYLSEYYKGIPQISDSSHLMIMLRTFCELIWKTPAFTVEQLSADSLSIEAPFSKSMPESDDADSMINMKTMERRYAFENEMIRAVELGLSQYELTDGGIFSGEFFAKRSSDPLRNAKNYGVIMNTLLRKAAEKGGVHPIYLDRVSSEFALRLEGCATVAENTSLMIEMFRTYCRLVRKHRLKGYSLIVQKIILSIDADISENLSSGALAVKHGISLGYLSSVFKRETGKTVSEYVRERRMEYARYLLSNTKLQIQTVAFNCGIMDVQYFSKLFKTLFGQTPSEYRLSVTKTK